MAAGSLRPNIVRVMSANRERPLRTQEIYEAGAKTGVAGFAPRAKRDRNRVNRELSDLAAMIPESHSKPTPQLLARVGRGHYIFREPEFPMDLALMREYLEPEEVYEKRPPRGRERAAESVRMALFAVQQGICPGRGIYLPHQYMRFEVGLDVPNCELFAGRYSYWEDAIQIPVGRLRHPMIDGPRPSAYHPGSSRRCHVNVTSRR